MRYFRDRLMMPIENLKAYSYLLHILVTIIVFTRAYWGFEASILMPELFGMVPTLIVPGLALLSSLRYLEIEFPYMLGISIAIGIVFKSLLLFVLSITYFNEFYIYIAATVFTLSSYCIYHNRFYILRNIKQTQFDLLHVAFYLGLFIGLKMISNLYGNLFDSSLESGAVVSPLLNKHSFLYTAYALGAGDGLPFSFQHYEASNKFVHLPLSGFAISAMSGSTNNLLLSTFQCYLLGVFAISSMLALCGSVMFKRNVGILAAIIFCLYFYPTSADVWQYFLYFPQLMGLLGCLVFLVVAINFSQAHASLEILPILLITFASSYICLINNQLFMVFFPTAAIYFLFMIITSKRQGDWLVWLLPITAMGLSFWFNVNWNSSVYPSIVLGGGDMRSVAIEYKPFKNILVVDGIKNISLYSIVYFFYKNSFGIGLLGLFWLAGLFKKAEKVSYQASHLFLWTGVTISILFGSAFYVEAGASSFYWYMFAFLFLFYYGCDVLCRNKIVGMLVTWAIIFGVMLFPSIYRLNHDIESGKTDKDIYALSRSVAPLLPPASRILWLSDHPDDEALSYQYVFEWATNIRCSYQYWKPTIDGIDQRNELLNKVKFVRATHLISPLGSLDNMFVGSDIHIKMDRKIEVKKPSNQVIYLYSLEYVKHFI